MSIDTIETILINSLQNIHIIKSSSSHNNAESIQSFLLSLINSLSSHLHDSSDSISISSNIIDTDLFDDFSSDCSDTDSDCSFTDEEHSYIVNNAHRDFLQKYSIKPLFYAHYFNKHFHI